MAAAFKRLLGVSGERFRVLIIKKAKRRFEHQRHLSHHAGSEWGMPSCIFTARGLGRPQELLWRGGFEFITKGSQAGHRYFPRQLAVWSSK